MFFSINGPAPPGRSESRAGAGSKEPRGRRARRARGDERGRCARELDRRALSARDHGITKGGSRRAAPGLRYHERGVDRLPLRIVVGELARSPGPFVAPALDTKTSVLLWDAPPKLSASSSSIRSRHCSQPRPPAESRGAITRRLSVFPGAGRDQAFRGHPRPRSCPSRSAPIPGRVGMPPKRSVTMSKDLRVAAGGTVRSEPTISRAVCAAPSCSSARTPAPPAARAHPGGRTAARSPRRPRAGTRPGTGATRS